MRRATRLRSDLVPDSGSNVRRAPRCRALWRCALNVLTPDCASRIRSSSLTLTAGRSPNRNIGSSASLQVQTGQI